MSHYHMVLLSFCLLLVLELGSLHCQTLPQKKTNITMEQAANKQVIVVSIPEDKYYKTHFNDICQFVSDLAFAAKDHDEVIALFPKKFASRLDVTTSGSSSSATKHKNGGQCNLGQASVITVDESIDLWMRDFGLGLPRNPVKFIYGPSYLSRSDARFVDNSFRRWMERFNVTVPESGLILDGGNVVDNGQDKAVVTDRFFYENPKTRESVLQAKMEGNLGMKVAIIPDPEDTTGHADGVVSFIDSDTLLIADYCDEEYYKMVEDSVLEVFPDLKIVKLPCTEEKKSKKKKDSRWRGFSSSVGAYVNILMTDSTLYVPQFGDEKRDREALRVVSANSKKRVVPVDTSRLSHMGGSIRCLTWQIAASHKLAEAMLKAATKPGK
eukprot:gene17597-19350_t